MRLQATQCCDRDSVVNCSLVSNAALSRLGPGSSRLGPGVTPGSRGQVFPFSFLELDFGNGQAPSSRIFRCAVPCDQSRRRARGDFPCRRRPEPVSRCPGWRLGPVQLDGARLLSDDQPLPSVGGDPGRESVQGHATTQRRLHAALQPH